MNASRSLQTPQRNFRERAIFGQHVRQRRKCFLPVEKHWNAASRLPWRGPVSHVKHKGPASKALSRALNDDLRHSFSEQDRAIILSQAALVSSALGDRKEAGLKARQALAASDTEDFRLSDSDLLKMDGVARSPQEVLTRIADFADAGLNEYAAEAAERALCEAEGYFSGIDQGPLLRALAGGLARLGRFDQALTVADAMSTDTSDGLCCLAEMAAALAGSGFQDRATECASRAIELIVQSRPHDAVICELVAILGRAGLFDSALDAAAQVKALDQKAEALKKLLHEAAFVIDFCGTTLDIGNLRNARNALLVEIEEHADHSLRARALAKLARGSSPAEMRHQARFLGTRAIELCLSINGQAERAILLSEVAAELSHIKDLAKTSAQKALDTADALERRESLDVLAKVAKNLADAGLFDQALNATERKDFTGLHPDVVVSIARSLINANRLEEAEKLARTHG